MKLYLFLVAAVIALAGLWGLTTLTHTAARLTDHTQSVNQIIDEASR